MKTIYNWIWLAAAMALTACQKSQEYYEGVYIVGTEGKEVTASLVVDEGPAALGINVAASNVVNEDLEVTLQSKPELVASFNKEYKKNYELLPADAYRLENTTLLIQKGKHIGAEGVRLSIVDRSKMKIGTTYLLPVSITHVKGGDFAVVEASRTIYVVVNQVIVTQAANLEPGSGGARHFVVNFGTPSKYNTKALKNVTFEARVRFRRMLPNSRKWCFSVMGCEENLCLRTAGSAKDGWKLQVGDPHHFDSRDVLPNDKWLHLACVFNGDTGKKYMYINGELQGEITDGRPTIDLTNHYAQTGFYIGQSANDDRYMDGWVSEARVWAVARSAADLKNNVCWVDPLSEGLVAYWRFNEPSADNPKMVTDLTGNGYHAVTHRSWYDVRFVPGVRCPDIEAE